MPRAEPADEARPRIRLPEARLGGTPAGGAREPPAQAVDRETVAGELLLSGASSPELLLAPNESRQLAEQALGLAPCPGHQAASRRSSAGNSKNRRSSRSTASAATGSTLPVVAARASFGPGSRGTTPAARQAVLPGFAEASSTWPELRGATLAAHYGKLAFAGTATRTRGLPERALRAEKPKHRQHAPVIIGRGRQERAS